MGYLIEKSYVYIVLQHNTEDSDAVFHGVYTDKTMADGKMVKVLKSGTKAYISILKKPINGVITKLTKYCY